MAFPGIEIEAVLNPSPIIEPLKFWARNDAPENSWAIDYNGSGSAFLATSDKPIVGLSSGGGFPDGRRLLAYGIFEKNFGIADYDSGGLGYDDSYAIFNGYYYWNQPAVVPIPPSGTQDFNFAVGATGPFNTNEIDTQNTVPLIEVDFAVTTYNSIMMGGSACAFPNDVNSIGLFREVRNTLVPKSQFEILVRHYNDGTPSVIYEATKYAENARFDLSGAFANVTIGDNIWRLQGITDLVSGDNQLAIIRTVPNTFVIDGAGTYDYEIFRLIFDDPIIQALLDQYNSNGFLENMWFSASTNGWLITYFDGVEYKLILLEIDGTSYRPINLVPKDATSISMLADFQAQNYPLSESTSNQKVSNFKYYNGLLYFTVGQNFLAPLISLSFVLPNTGNPTRVALPCMNPCIPFIVEK